MPRVRKATPAPTTPHVATWADGGAWPAGSELNVEFIEGAPVAFLFVKLATGQVYSVPYAGRLDALILQARAWCRFYRDEGRRIADGWCAQDAEAAAAERSGR